MFGANSCVSYQPPEPSAVTAVRTGHATSTSNAVSAPMYDLDNIVLGPTTETSSPSLADVATSWAAAVGLHVVWLFLIMSCVFNAFGSVDWPAIMLVSYDTD